MCVYIEPEEDAWTEEDLVAHPVANRWSMGPEVRPVVNIQQHARGHDNPKVKAVIDVLYDWFMAMEDGTHTTRFPDPEHKRRKDKDPWTDAEVDAVIGVLDHEIDYEMSQRPTYWRERGYDIPTDFSRLDPPQRRALVQQIDDALRTSEQRS